MSDSVSLSQGHDSLASSGVKTTSDHFTEGSRPTLFSQFRGPFLYNETDEERQKREEEENRKKDADKQTNFDKVREKAEREEAARKKAEEERDALRKEKSEREEAERKAAEAKLEEEKKHEELAAQRKAEAEKSAAEAAKEKERADSAEARLKAIEEKQEAELEELLKGIPEDKRPPLDATDHVTKRLDQVKYVLSLLESGPKPRAGGGAPSNGTSNADREKELRKKLADGTITSDESFELMELTGEAT